MGKEKKLKNLRQRPYINIRASLCQVTIRGLSVCSLCSFEIVSADEIFKTALDQVDIGLELSGELLDNLSNKL
jgi:hypothetical protein